MPKQVGDLTPAVRVNLLVATVEHARASLVAFCAGPFRFVRDSREVNRAVDSKGQKLFPRDPLAH